MYIIQLLYEYYLRLYIDQSYTYYKRRLYVICLLGVGGVLHVHRGSRGHDGVYFYDGCRLPWLLWVDGGR